MNPITLILDGDSDNKFVYYIKEILLSEGYNSFDVVDLKESSLCMNDIVGRTLVIMDTSVERKLDVKIMEQYLNNGGNLIAIRPPVKWDYLFGLERVKNKKYRKTVDGYLITNHSTYMTHNIIPDKIQFLGPADLYHAKEGTICLNHLSGIPEKPSLFPGVAASSYGKGKTVIFTYDLPGCIVRLHQGRERYSSTGEFPSPEGMGKFVAFDLFKDQFDYNLMLVPQADIHQDILTRMIRILTGDKFPVPRLWHFPDAAPSVVSINGDIIEAPGSNRKTEDFMFMVNTVEKYGCKYTVLGNDNFQSTLEKDEITKIVERGHEFGIHPSCTSKPTAAEMNSVIKKSVDSFRKKFGFNPLTCRNYGAVWTGWTDTAKALSQNGVRIDLNFQPPFYKYGEGFLNGSALPVKPVDSNGDIIDLYIQSYQSSDSLMVSSEKRMNSAYSYKEAIEHSLQIVRTCMKYHGVVSQVFHPEFTGHRKELNNLKWLHELLTMCVDSGLPFINFSQWAHFNDARRSVNFNGFDWKEKDGIFSFEAVCKYDIKGLTVMLPAQTNNKRPTKVTKDGKNVFLEISSKLEGCAWTLFSIDLKKNVKTLIKIFYD